MSRYRALALRASLVAVLAATVGVATLTPGTASAAPSGTATATSHGPYPPASPNMVVNRGTVKVGAKVKATGRKYASKEKVFVTVLFRPKGGDKYKAVKKATVRADKKGKFHITVRLVKRGTVIIKGKGKSSNKSASATVHVTSKNGGNGGWDIKPASFTVGGTTGTNAVASTEASGASGVAIAGLAGMALIGSIVITRRTVRLRRRSGAAA